MSVEDLQRRREESASARPGMSLSPREVQVLTQLSTGASYGDIAKRLIISLDTVKSHLKRVFVKLGAKNGAHAVGLGYQLKILSPDASRLEQS